jgi:hypothetical protein
LKYINVHFIFKYFPSDLDAFIAQFTNQVYEDLADKRYMTMYYLYENNYLDRETENLLSSNSDKFRQALKFSNTIQELRNNLNMNFFKVLVLCATDQTVINKKANKILDTIFDDNIHYPIHYNFTYIGKDLTKGINMDINDITFEDNGVKFDIILNEFCPNILISDESFDYIYTQLRTENGYIIVPTSTSPLGETISSRLKRQYNFIDNYKIEDSLFSLYN